MKAKAASDDTHVGYWRAIDDFFLPGLASPTPCPMSTGCTSPRSSGGNLHGFRRRASGMDVLPRTAGRGGEFRLRPASPAAADSEYYGNSQANILDSLWKFGGACCPPIR